VGSNPANPTSERSAVLWRVSLIVRLCCLEIGRSAFGGRQADSDGSRPPEQDRSAGIRRTGAVGHGSCVRCADAIRASESHSSLPRHRRRDRLTGCCGGDGQPQSRTYSTRNCSPDADGLRLDHRSVDCTRWRRNLFVAGRAHAGAGVSNQEYRISASRNRELGPGVTGARAHRIGASLGWLLRWPGNCAYAPRGGINLDNRRFSSRPTVPSLRATYVYRSVYRWGPERHPRHEWTASERSLRLRTRAPASYEPASRLFRSAGLAIVRLRYV
jgi:hypothetical protein